MKGFQITFYTQQMCRQHGKPLADWLIQLARELKIHGATEVVATKGVGKHHHIHSAHFFELADQPIMVIMVVTPEEAELLFNRLETEQVKVFYVKYEVEFGILGEE